jgi:L-cystine uptake protein TcyP (sodium:dicarboxylate symporter family)
VAKRLTYYILAGLVLGVLVGWVLNVSISDGTPESDAQLKTIAGYISILTTIFLHLIKMIIAPLVFRPSSSASPIWATPPRSGGWARRRSAGSWRRA